MNDKIREILEDIEAMKLKLADEIAKQETHISYEIQNGCVKFEKEVLAKQKENKKNLLSGFRKVHFLYFLTAPLIYGMVIPIIIFDALLFVYKQVVFRTFKFKFIKRSDYIIFDHHYLGYLNSIEKFNCLYCSYFNGLAQYASAIAGRTELYFCPVKHAKKVANEHSFYEKFLSYGDEKEYQEKLKELRENSKDN